MRCPDLLRSALLLLALTSLPTQAQQASADARAALIPFGSVAPELAGLVLSGAPDTRLSQFRGRVVVVDFWATWCAPCLQSMPQLNTMRAELNRKYGDRFEIVGVNTDSDVAKARRFLELNPVEYPIIGDPLGVAMKRFGPWKLPASFLLTPEGKVHMIWLGYADNFVADIQQMAEELLRAMPAAAP